MRTFAHFSKALRFLNQLERKLNAGKVGVFDQRGKQLKWIVNSDSTYLYISKSGRGELRYGIFHWTLRKQNEIYEIKKK